MLMAGISLLVASDTALARDGGNMGDHGGMMHSDPGRSDHHEGRAAREGGEMPSRNRPSAPGDGRKNTIHPIVTNNPGGANGNGKPVASPTGGVTNTIHPIVNNNPVGGNGSKSAPVTSPTGGVTNTIHPIVSSPAPGSDVVTVSNGVSKVQIPNGPGGVSVYSSSPGTITVTNGSESKTLSGGSVTLSGNVIGVGGGQNVEVGKPNGEGSTVVAVKPPPPPASSQPNTGFDNNGVPGGGLLKGAGDFGYGVVHGFAPGSAPPDHTSTSVQQ